MSESDFPTLSEPGPRSPRRAGRARIWRWGIRGLLTVLTAVLIVQLALQGWSGRPKKLADPPDQQNKVNANSLQPGEVLPSPQHQAWEKAVVAIQSRGGVDQRSVGSGFFVAETGLIATSLHVSAGCTEAAIRTFDGATYEVAGYAAVDEEHDLALLRLKDPPQSPIGLALAGAEDPPRRKPVWAIGHPDGIEFSASAGEVSRVVQTGDLPAASQRFLRELLNVPPASKVATWIQHSADIAPGSSGGPLVDAAGHVLGINSWVDREARFNYALPVRYLTAMLPGAREAKTQPLEAHASSEARNNQQLWQLSANRLQKLLEQGRNLKWQPQSAEDYLQLQQLAWAITVSRLPDALAVRGSLGDRLDELAKAADAAAAELRKEQWNNAGQVTILNEFAATELRRPLAGLFFFATVERLVEAEKRRGLICTLAGFDEPVFLALEDQLVVPEAGAQCLVLGVNYNGRVAQWGDNPLKLISAPIVVPGVILKLE